MRRIIPLVAIASLLVAAGLPTTGGQSAAAPQDSSDGADHPLSDPMTAQDGPRRTLSDGPGTAGQSEPAERGTVQGPQALLQSPMAQRGQDIFHTRCIGCHSIGTHVGSAADLLGVTRTRDRDWLARWLASPEQLVKAGDPVATALVAENRNVLMPTMRLTPGDVEALLTYMEAQSQR